jgi:cytochrome b6-f complex iron-sulfur subunit
VNVPAAKARVEGTGEEVADPGTDVLALYRKCPHLGCNVPQLCDRSEWFECLCHGSKYTVLGEKRDGPAPRGMDRFSVELTEGAYVIDTSRVESGPPIGTETFDTRKTADIPHCAA